MDLQLHFKYHRVKAHHTDDCFMLRWDIEALIQKGFLKKFIAKRKKFKSPGGKEALLKDRCFRQETLYIKRGG